VRARDGAMGDAMDERWTSDGETRGWRDNPNLDERATTKRITDRGRRLTDGRMDAKT
jgi:hypothetical protein